MKKQKHDSTVDSMVLIYKSHRTPNVAKMKRIAFSEQLDSMQ